jgi:hypothetical protein
MPKRKFTPATMKKAYSYARRAQRRRIMAKKRTTLATKVRKLTQIVNKTFETKTYDKLYDLTIGSGGSNQPVQFELAQGEQNDQRIGNKVTLRSVTVDASYLRADSYNRIRVILVEPLDGNEPVGLSDVLKYTNYQTHGDLVFASPYTTTTTTDRRYKIIADSVFELNANKNYHQKKFTIKYPKQGKVVSYDGASVQPTSWNLQLLHISDSVAAPYPTAKLNIRFKFIDA